MCFLFWEPAATYSPSGCAIGRGALGREALPTAPLLPQLRFAVSQSRPAWWVELRGIGVCWQAKQKAHAVACASCFGNRQLPIYSKGAAKSLTGCLLLSVRNSRCALACKACLQLLSSLGFRLAVSRTAGAHLRPPSQCAYASTVKRISGMHTTFR